MMTFLMNVTFYVPALIRNSSWLVKDQQREGVFPWVGIGRTRLEEGVMLIKVVKSYEFYGPIAIFVDMDNFQCLLENLWWM